MKKYRKKPVVIEAVQYNGVDNFKEIEQFVGEKNIDTYFSCFNGKKYTEISFGINTLEGSMHVSRGDYIIKGIQGEFYPCKPDIFEATYEKV